MKRMVERYPATYCDEWGEERTVIMNDGKTLQMVVRGVRFAGDDFDSLEPVPATEPDLLKRFVINDGWLCACTIAWEMPILVVVTEDIVRGSLHARLDLGKPRPHDGIIDREALLLSLHYGGRRVVSCGQHGFFDDELREIKAQLPEGTFLKICHSCAPGHYPAGGFGLFGGLGCFRDLKERARDTQYRSPEYWRLFEEGVTEWVQESYLCPEFESAE